MVLFLLSSAVGVDFQQLDPNPSALIFDNANQNQALCRVVIILNDLIFEGNEAFYAIISNPNSIAGVTLDSGMARITILEDDLQPEMPGKWLLCFSPVCVIPLLAEAETTCQKWGRGGGGSAFMKGAIYYYILNTSSIGY